MNFAQHILERFPASKPALVAIDAEGRREQWHFGELLARTAGLSGALAARGVGRGDVVMTLIGNRPEWVLSMLACFRIGAVAMPCNVQLRRSDLEHRVAAANPRLAIGEEAYLGELPDGILHMTLAELAQVLDEDLPQEAPVEPVDLDPDDPAVIIFTSGTTGEPRGVVYPQRYLTGQRLQAEHWFGARDGELAWCTAATGWSKSARNVFIAPWLMRRRRSAARRLASTPRSDCEIAEREGVNVLCQAPTEYRMIAETVRAAPAPLAAPPGLRRRAAQPGGDQGVPGGRGPGDPRRLRADRDRRDHGNEGGRGPARRLDGPAAAGHRGARRRRRATAPRPRPAPPSSPATSTGSRSTASGGRPATT